MLAVEDMPVNRVILEALLERDGHHVTLAEDGRVALDLYNPDNYDVLLVDLQMPRMDGLSLIREIRGQERSGARRMPVVVVTANVTARDREQSFAAGADGFVTKPLELASLRAALRRATGVPEA